MASTSALTAIVERMKEQLIKRDPNILKKEKPCKKPKQRSRKSSSLLH